MINENAVLALKSVFDGDAFDVNQQISLMGENSEDSEIAITPIANSVEFIHTTILEMVKLNTVFREMNLVELLADKLKAMQLINPDIKEVIYLNTERLREFIQAVEEHFDFVIEESGYCLNVHEGLNPDEVLDLGIALFEIMIEQREIWSVDFYFNYVVRNIESLSKETGLNANSLMVNLEGFISEAKANLHGMPFSEWISYISMDGSSRDILDQIVIDSNISFPEKFVLDVKEIDVFSKLMEPKGGMQ